MLGLEEEGMRLFRFTAESGRAGPVKSGVVVRVIKIFEQNIGQFLQVNDLEGTSDLMRVGRLIARKTDLPR